MAFKKIYGFSKFPVNFFASGIGNIAYSNTFVGTYYN